MNFSAFDFNSYGVTYKSPNDEIELGQGLQSFLKNSAITKQLIQRLNKPKAGGVHE